MALEKAFTTPQGIPCPNAYHRIVNARVHKADNGNFMSRASVSTYFDKASRDAGKPPIATRGWAFAYDIESEDNLLIQGYTHLKSLEDFSGALDV